MPGRPEAAVASGDSVQWPCYSGIPRGWTMAAGIQLPGNNETIDLQQQVFRLQALLEASRQVHSTIREEEVLESVLRIVVRELEMAGAAFPGTGLAYGDPIDSMPVNAARQRRGDGAGQSSERAGFSACRPRRQAHDRAGGRYARTAAR